MLNSLDSKRLDRAVPERRGLHRYVVIVVGLLGVMLATFPLAYMRVSNSSKYTDGPFNSLELDQSQKSDFGKKTSEGKP